LPIYARQTSNNLVYISYLPAECLICFIDSYKDGQVLSEALYNGSKELDILLNENGHDWDKIDIRKRRLSLGSITIRTRLLWWRERRSDGCCLFIRGRSRIWGIWK
jgi:hypothetical protein